MLSRPRSLTSVPSRLSFSSAGSFSRYFNFLSSNPTRGREIDWIELPAMRTCPPRPSIHFANRWALARALRRGVLRGGEPRRRVDERDLASRDGGVEGLHARAGDAAVPQVQRLEILQCLQLRQACISDAAAIEIELTQFAELRENLRARVGDLSAEHVQAAESAHLPQMLYAGIP